MKPAIAIRIVLMLLMLPSLALAHGGGLDGYGGHNNRKQGGYHFHRGPLAGNHYTSKSEALNALSSGSDNKANVAPVPRPRKAKEGLKNEK
ncbi:YHYH domain-containing protein [Thiovibrio sp. JS02]